MFLACLVLKDSSAGKGDAERRLLFSTVLHLDGADLEHRPPG